MSINNTGSNALTYIFQLIKSRYVAKVFKTGSSTVYKTLSDNDLTDALKANYDAAYTHAQTAHAPSGAQANVIETVKVNGSPLTPSSKAVDISVPTVPSISTNIATDAASDAKTASPKAVKSYVDEVIPTVPTISTDISTDASSDVKTASPKAVKSYVDGAIGNIASFSFQILGNGEYDANRKPTVTGASNKIYLVPLSSAETNNAYAEWIYTNNAWEKIGETSMDLSGYVQESDIVELTNTQIQSIWDSVLASNS